MLAVQQPASVFGDMAQDKRPAKSHSLFGYNIDPHESTMNPPEPPLGAPLLTNSDTDFLSNFLDSVGTEQYNANSYGEGLGLQFSTDWFNFELPPQFMGTSTSFGQQNSQSPSASSPGHATMGIDPMVMSSPMHTSHMMPPPPVPPQQLHQQYQQHQNQQHSADILTAAATLASRSNHHQDFSTQRRSIGPPVGHLRHQPLEEFHEDGRRGISQNSQEPTLSDWMNPDQGRRGAPRHGIQTELQWGSDSNFISAHGYNPETSDKETVESMHRDQMRILEALEVSRSATSTRPSSPSNGQHAPTHSNPPRGVIIISNTEDDDAPPRKRRKSKNIKEGPGLELDEDDGASSKPSRRRKSKVERSIATPPSSEGHQGSSGKRRKSGVNGTKPPRENLSEEQKRENHIKSEQKRRTLIKEGFEDLCEMVPALAGGGFSKSSMLTVAADWLDEILKVNRSIGVPQI